MLKKYHYALYVPNHRILAFKDQERSIKNAKKIQKNHVNKH